MEYDEVVEICTYCGEKDKISMEKLEDISTGEEFEAMMCKACKSVFSGVSESIEEKDGKKILKLKYY